MSRVGRAVIKVPSGVEVRVADGAMTVKGPRGTLSRPLPSGVEVEIQDSEVRVQRGSDSKPMRARHGLVRALLANMVVGVSQGFTRVLEIQGVGYRAEAKGKTLNLMLGFSHPVEMSVPEGLKVSVEGTTLVTIEGNDPEIVGQFAADVRALRPPEPYKGKGVRYRDEEIRRKVGKAGTG